MTRRQLPLVLALFVLILAPAWYVGAQGQSEIQHQELSVPILPAAPETPPAPPFLAAVGDEREFLPLLMSPPSVQIEFATTPDDSCNPFTPATTFNYGIKYLCYQVIFAGAKGQSFRTEWFVNGTLQTGLGRTGTIGENLQVRAGVICYGPSGACGEAVPRGTWQLRAYLNNQLYREATAVIR